MNLKTLVEANGQWYQEHTCCPIFGFKMTPLIFSTSHCPFFLSHSFDFGSFSHSTQSTWKLHKVVERNNVIQKQFTKKFHFQAHRKDKNWKLDAKNPLDDVWAKRHTKGRENHKKITIYSPFSTMRVSSNKRCEHIFPSRLLLAYSFHYNLPRGYSFFTSALWHSNN